MATEPRWLTDTEQRAWRSLIAMVVLLPGELDRQLQRDSGLSQFEYGVLAMLSEAPERTLRMSQLAALNDSSLSRLSHVARRLEDKGFIVRQTCSDDRRATNATLTDAGMAVVVAAAPTHVEHVRQLIFDRLTESQVEQLTEIASVIASTLDPERRLPTHLPDPAG